jgi:hypothetical protein
MVESPRWHDDRLWFPHWGTDEIIATDLEGNAEVVARGVAGMVSRLTGCPTVGCLRPGSSSRASNLTDRACVTST